MSIMEKVAYLKGLAEGLGLDSDSKEGKLMSVIIDTISDMAEEIANLGENALNLGEEIDALSDDLADVEEYLFEDEDDSDFFDFGYDDDEDDDEDDDDFGCGICGEDYYPDVIECPTCGADIELDPTILALGSVKCSCGEEIEFEFDEEDGDYAGEDVDEG